MTYYDIKQICIIFLTDKERCKRSGGLQILLMATSRCKSVQYCHDVDAEIKSATFHKAFDHAFRLVTRLIRCLPFFSHNNYESLSEFVTCHGIIRSNEVVRT